ncbi:hypothetical protein P3L10_021701 [Capsicum annuum]
MREYFVFVISNHRRCIMKNHSLMTNMACGAVDGVAPPLIRGRGFNPGYRKNSVGSAAILMGPATRDPD